MALTVDDMVASDVEESLLRTVLSHWEGGSISVEWIFPTPLHAGGGWHRMKATAMDFAHKVLDDVSTWLSFNPHMPSLFNNMKLTVSSEGLDAFMAEALEKGSVDTVLPVVYTIVRDGNSGIGLYFAELLSSHCYLPKQPVQGTKTFEESTFFLLALLTSEPIHLPDLPPLPGKQHANEKTVLNWFIDTLEFFVKRKREAVHTRFVLPTFSSALKTPESAESFEMYFRSSPDRGEDRIRIRNECLLSGSVVFDLLVQKSIAKLPKSEIVGEDLVFLKEMESNPSAAYFPERKLLVNRIREESLLHRKSMNPEYLLQSDDCLVEAIYMVSREIESIKGVVAPDSFDIVNAANSKLSILMRCAKLKPELEMKDLLGLFCSSNAYEILSKKVVRDISKLLQQMIKLRHLSRIMLALDALLSSNEESQKEMFLELLVQKRFHDNDPRLLVVEFESGYLLRQLQVDLFYEELCRDSSSCRQVKNGRWKIKHHFANLIFESKCEFTHRFGGSRESYFHDHRNDFQVTRRHLFSTIVSIPVQ